MTVEEQIIRVIRNNPYGIDKTWLSRQTGIDPVSLERYLSELQQQGKITLVNGKYVLRSGMSTTQEQMSEETKQSTTIHNVCKYLKQKIPDEERETDTYKRMETALEGIPLDYSMHGSIRTAQIILAKGQDGEVEGLKLLYRAICGEI